MKKIVLLILVLLVTVSCQKEEKISVKKRVDVRWFVGLGAGSDEPTFEPQRKIVEDFNNSQDRINLILEIVKNSAAVDTLAIQLSSGNAPDLVGPVGIQGRDYFKGSWEDLQPYIDKHNFDMSVFNPRLVDFYRDENEGLIGIPFAVYPSFLYINKDLFDEAGLSCPPEHFGEEYIDETGTPRTWDVYTMREVAKKLTVDAQGRDSLDPDFDSDNIVQFGYGPQWFSSRQLGTLFGSGSMNKDGKATIPEHWEEAWKFFYEGMWYEYWTPNAPYQNSDLLGQGDLFASGNIAMVHSHLWYAGFMEVDFNWAAAVVPSYNGNYTAALNADTFEIPRLSKNKEAAFEVMMYLLDNACMDLLKIYGGMPAREELQQEYLESLEKGRFASQNINWNVALSSIAYADVPGYESWIPNTLESGSRIGTFWDKVRNNKNLDIPSMVDVLEKDLQTIFDAAQ